MINMQKRIVSVWYRCVQSGPVLAVLLLGILYRPEEAFMQTSIFRMRDICRIMETVHSGIPLYIREIAGITASDCCILHFLSGTGLHLNEKRQLVKILDWYPVYIHWTCTIPDRGKCRIYAEGNYLGQVLQDFLTDG